MIRLIWRTDVHLSDRAPSSRTDDWADTVFNKLEQIRKVAEKISADAIIDGGDFFHIKSPSKNSHELVRRTADLHRLYPCPVYCVPGNHDCTYGDYSFLPQQPLGVLYSTGVYKRLYDEHEAIFVSPEGVKVRVVGIPYHGNFYDLNRFKNLKKGDEDVLICAAHVLASLDGGKMFEGEDIIRYADLLDTAPDVYLFGHWHKDQGIEKLGSKTFVNVGSLTRGSLSQDDVQRRPACVVLNCSKTGVDPKIIRLKVGSPEEVFDLEGRERQISRQENMDEFVGKIKETLLSEDTGLSLTETVSAMEEVASEVKEKALSYLERVH
jgi:DNA repair exonuclease SbcCD nuclease subunit